MRCFWDDGARAHRPAQEFFNGALHPAADRPDRVDAILAAIGPVEAPRDPGSAALLAALSRVHDADYLAFLATAHDAWRAAGREGDALPYCFPVTRRPLALERIDARLGQFSYDTCTPVCEGTWDALLAGTRTLLAAAEVVEQGGHAFALTRPPGHHAGPACMGGYSYLNWAAVAAFAGGRRTAILDLDYHHGNGTQDIVVAAGDGAVRFASVHADPRTDYPFFWGHAAESGGPILNLPLPRGTTIEPYAQAVASALEWLGGGTPERLVVSFGADTWEGDPISHFRLRTADYRRLGQQVAAFGSPTLIVMEGGYAIEALGDNVAGFLAGF